MQSVSENWKTAIAADIREMDAKVEVYQGEVLLHTLLPSGVLQSVCVSGAHTDPVGWCVSRTARVTIVDPNGETAIPFGTELRVYFGVKVGASFEYVPYGRYYVDGAVRNAYTVEVVGTDVIAHTLAQYTAADVTIATPCTLQQYAAAIAAKGGVTAAFDAGLCNNLTYTATNTPNLAGTEKLPDLLAQIAQATGSGCFADASGNLRFRALTGAAVKTISGDTYFDFSVSGQKAIAKITSATDANDNVSAGTDDGLNLVLRDNAFLVNRDDLGACLDALLAQLNGLGVASYTLDWRGDPALEPGDLVSVSLDDASNPITIPYLGESVTYAGGFNATATFDLPDAENPEAAPSSLGEALNQTRIRVDKAEKRIESLVQEIETIPALNLNFSRDNAVVFVPASGTPDLSAAAVMLTCTLGGVDQTDAAEITFAPVGLTGSYDAETHIYTVTAMTATTGYVTITAAYDGQTASRRYTVVQARDGADGTNGKDGTDGISVVSLTAHYAASASGDTAPTDGWSDTMPERDDTQYLWGYYTVTFSDGTTQDTVPYVVAGAGETYTELTGQLQRVEHEYQTKIEQTKAEILQTASETYATAETVSKQQSQIDQSAKRIDFVFEDATGRIQKVSDALADDQATLRQYIRFTGALMELGRSDNDFVARLSNEKLAFLENGTEIAYISNHQLYILDAQIKGRLTIANEEIGMMYDHIVRSNGHYSIVRRRG